MKLSTRKVNALIALGVPLELLQTPSARQKPHGLHLQQRLHVLRGKDSRQGTEQTPLAPEASPTTKMTIASTSRKPRGCIKTPRMSAAFADEASECSQEAMAEQGSSERARREIDVKPYFELDLTQIELKDHGMGRNGHLCDPLIEQEPIRFNLTPNDWVYTFGFDNEFNTQSFKGIRVQNETSNMLYLQVEVQKEQADFLTKLDMTCKSAFFKIAEGRCARWKNMVTTDPVFGNSTCKIGVVLDGKDLTRIAIVTDGKVERGEGRSFIEPFFKHYSGFKNAEVKISVKVRELWDLTGMAGLSLGVTHLVLRATQRRVEKDPFADDSELLA